MAFRHVVLLGGMFRGVAAVANPMRDGSTSEVTGFRFHFQIVVHIEMQHHVGVPLHAVLRVQMSREIARTRKHAVAERTHTRLGLLGLRGVALRLLGIGAPGTHERLDPGQLPRVHAHAARVEPQVADVALDEVALGEGGLQAVAVQLAVAVLLHTHQQALHDLLAFLLRVVQLAGHPLVHLRHQRAQQLLDLADLRGEAAATARQDRARVRDQLGFAQRGVGHAAKTRQLQRPVRIELAVVVVQVAANDGDRGVAGEAGQDRRRVGGFDGVSLLTVGADRVAQSAR